MNEFIQSNGGVVSTVVLVALVLNVALSGISKALEVIKDKTATKADDNVWAFLVKVVAVLQKVTDWGSGNRQHK